jgi:hypothetical protein
MNAVDWFSRHLGPGREADSAANGIGLSTPVATLGAWLPPSMT